MDPDPSPSIEVAVEDDQWPSIVTGPEKCCVDAIRACLPFLSLSLEEGVSPSIWSVSVLLTDDSAIRDLNRRHRGIDKPTNVLSFPLADVDEIESSRLPLMLGDIILAAQTVEREAVAQRKTVKDHFMHLVIHGFLHLIGYDHIDDDEAAAMEALESRILASLCIADPYADELMS